MYICIRIYIYIHTYLCIYIYIYTLGAIPFAAGGSRTLVVWLCDAWSESVRGHAIPQKWMRTRCRWFEKVFVAFSGTALFDWPWLPDAF